MMVSFTSNAWCHAFDDASQAGRSWFIVLCLWGMPSLVMESALGGPGFHTEIWIFRDISSVTVGMVFVVENSRPEGLETLL